MVALQKPYIIAQPMIKEKGYLVSLAIFRNNRLDSLLSTSVLKRFKSLKSAERYIRNYRECHYREVLFITECVIYRRGDEQNN